MPWGPTSRKGLSKLEGAGKQRVVVLASGDPLFYGVARYLCDKLGKDRFEVVPHVSSMQLAFARVKESWEEAFLTNLASHGVESVLEQIRSAEKVGLFTSDSYTPSVVATILLEQGLDYFIAYVCENLGSPDERVTRGELKEIADGEFSPLNVMILVRKPHVPIVRARQSDAGCSAIPTRPSCSRSPSEACSHPQKSEASRWLSWILGRRASCGISAPAAVRSPSRQRKSLPAEPSMPSRWIPTITS